MGVAVIPRVIHINTAKTWRGGERQVYNLACELDAKGIPQKIISKTNSPLAKKCISEGLSVHELPLRGEWDIFSAKKIAQIAIDFNANVLHAHTAKAHSITLFARKRLEKSIVFLISRRVDFPMRLNFLSKRKYKHALVDGYIAISENIKNVLINDGIEPTKIDVAYSGIDLALWQESRDPIALRSEFMLHPQTVSIGNVAALVDHKDHNTLLDAIYNLESEEQKQKLPSYRLFILGEGKLRTTLEKKARAMQILYPKGPVIFCGHRDDIYDFYHLFDLFVMSSKEEGLGTAVLDAMAAGLPVCATSAGGIPEMIVPGQGGFLSPVGDAAQMAQNLKKLLLSADLGNRFGAFNKKQVQKFSHANTAESNLNIYQKYLEKIK